MKPFFAILLCALPATVLGQGTMKTFTGPHGVFQFHYPAMLVRCTNQSHDQKYSGHWKPIESCQGGIPVCDDSSVSGSQTIACFAYPRAEFQNNPTFDVAAFAVAQINSAKTEKECLAITAGWVMYPPKNLNIVSINGTQFHEFHTSDAGGGHYQDGYAYLAFHHNTCYQLSVRISTLNGAMLAPPVEDFSEDAKVMRQLNQALDSFRFLK